MFHLCNITSLVSKWNIVYLDGLFNDVSNIPVRLDIFFFT